MAFRTSTYWKSMLHRLGGRSSFATSTTPKMKSYAAPAVDDYALHAHNTKPGPVRGDFVPVYVAIGMIVLSSSLGLATALHHLKRNPSVQVRKTRRETIPEVVDPDLIVTEGEKFRKGSIFRKIAHVQDHGEPTVPDYIRGDVFARTPRAETLKSVGVDPKTLTPK